MLRPARNRRPGRRPEQRTLREAYVLLAGGRLLRGESSVVRRHGVGAGDVLAGLVDLRTGGSSSVVTQSSSSPDADSLLRTPRLGRSSRAIAFSAWRGPILLLDRQRGVVVRTQVGVHHGLVLVTPRRPSAMIWPAAMTTTPVADVADDVQSCSTRSPSCPAAQVLGRAQEALRQSRVHTAIGSSSMTNCGRSSAPAPSRAACADPRTGCPRNRPSWRRA